VNMVALVDNVPRLLPLRSVIHNYVQHQREVIVRRSKHELRTLERQVHRLEGLLIALDNLDAVIALIRSSRDRDTARSGLMERFELTHVQAQAILDLRLQQLTALEADELRREHADKTERIRSCASCSATRTWSSTSSRPSCRRSPIATATSAARRSPRPRTTSTSRI